MQGSPYIGSVELGGTNRLPRKVSVISEVQVKIARLSMPRHMSYRPVLIHAGAIAESIAEQEYFASVIDFADLMAAA